jgi:hypothetical protein
MIQKYIKKSSEIHDFIYVSKIDIFSMTSTVANVHLISINVKGAFQTLLEYLEFISHVI